MNQILTDSTLKFEKIDSLRPQKASIYWVKFNVYSPFEYSQKSVVRFFPILDNTLYYYNYETQQWVSDRTGLLVENQRHQFLVQPFILQAKKINILYFKTDISALSPYQYGLLPAIAIDKEEDLIANKKNEDIITLITVCVLLAFLLFNGYIYFVFKDKTYFYYLITQIGGIVYILAFRHYFDSLITSRFYKVKSDATGGIWFSGLNEILVHISMAVILWALISLTRLYLNTRASMPFYDKILRFLSWINVGWVALVTVLEVCTPIFTEQFANYIHNPIAALIAGTILWVSFKSYRQKFRLARYFLLGNLIPLCIILFVGVYYILTPYILPYSGHIAVIAQAICLALALVERLLLIRDELKNKELEAQKLTDENLRYKADLDHFVELLRDRTETLEKLK
ncbi:MAG: 7TM-DISM domain-containing protein, partial [Runella sp.]